jgi:hypothetical protein
VVALAATDQVDGLGQGAPAPLTAGARVRARGDGCWECEVSVGAGTPLASS